MNVFRSTALSREVVLHDGAHARQVKTTSGDASAKQNRSQMMVDFLRRGGGPVENARREERRVARGREPCVRARRICTCSGLESVGSTRPMYLIINTS